MRKLNVRYLKYIYLILLVGVIFALHSSIVMAACTPYCCGGQDGLGIPRAGEGETDNYDSACKGSSSARFAGRCGEANCKEIPPEKGYCTPWPDQTWLYCCTPYYSICRPEGPVCGNGNVEDGEECDPAGSSCTKSGRSGICSSTCQCSLNPYCGDGTVNSGEECDPPGSSCTKSGRSGVCSSTCQCSLNPYCGDGTVNNGEECEGSGSCTCDGCGGEYEDRPGACSNCKCCVRCAPICPDPLISSAPVNPPHDVSEYFFDNITSCDDRSICQNPETRYADCYEIPSPQPTISLNKHPELVPTSLYFTSETHTGSGMYTDDPTLSDDSVNDFMPYSSIRYQNEDNLFYFEATFSDTDYPIEAGYIWFSKSSVKPVTPKNIDLDNSVIPEKYGTKNSSEFGFLLYHNATTNSWVPYIPAISGAGDGAFDVWKQAQSYSNIEIVDGKTIFSIPGSNSKKTANILLYSITSTNNGKKVKVKFSVSFKSNGSTLLLKLPDEGKYNIWMMANDTFGFTPYDNYEGYSNLVKNAIKNRWITNERIRYYDQWIDSGQDWNLNFDVPSVNLNITPSESVRTGLDISWSFIEDSDVPGEFSDLVINLYKSEGLTIPDGRITLSNIDKGGGSIIGKNTPFQPKINGQHTDVIGSLNEEVNYYLLRIHGGSGNGSATLDLGDVGQGKLYFYITVFDKGGNVGTFDKDFDLNDWIITHGGLLYSNGIDVDINSNEELNEWNSKPLLKRIHYEHADLSTEMVGIKMGILTSPVKSSDTLSYMIKPYDVENPKNGYYQTYKGYFDRRKSYIPNLKDLGDMSTLQDSLSTLGSGVGENDIAAVESTGNLYVNKNFKCDRRGVFFVAGDLTIDGKISNENLGKDACIFVVNGSVTIGNGDIVSSHGSMNYDEINAYILADGKIEISKQDSGSIYDGLYIDGGIHSLDEEGIVVKRSLKLWDRLRFPVLVVNLNSKYGVLSRSLFGSDILLQSIEVGVKP